MQISELQPRQGKVDIEVTVAELGEAREIEKPGFSGKVRDAQVKDESGSITLTLWNDDADKYQVGDKIKVSNGWVSEFQGNVQLSAGKFGKLEKVTGEETPEN